MTSDKKQEVSAREVLARWDAVSEEPTDLESAIDEVRNDDLVIGRALRLLVAVEDVLSSRRESPPLPEAALREAIARVRAWATGETSFDDDLRLILDALERGLEGGSK